MFFKRYTFVYAATLALASTLSIAMAGDPDILSDFTVPLAGPNNTDPSYFTYTGMHSMLSGDPSLSFKSLEASMPEFPALTGQSISFAVLEYPVGSVNPLHTHPRASELLFLIAGSLQVGFVDTSNKLFTQNLQVGDMFLFPKGLVHYQYNNDSNGERALAISAFGSANAGTISVPLIVFNTSIYVGILARSFRTEVKTIETIENGLLKE